MTLVLIILTLFSTVYSQLWDPNCGVSKYPDSGIDQGDESFIIGGWDAREHEFPWMVSVRTPGGNHYCGGVLITSKHVLTAAHCTEGESAEAVEVVVGEHIRDVTNPDKQVIQVVNIMQHEDYRPNFIYNDISLLELEVEVVMSENVAPICAPLDDLYENVTAAVSGWGSTQPDGGDSPQNLLYTNIWTMTNNDCRADACDNTLSLGPGSICAIGIEGGKCTGDNAARDSCYGDSGGPLAYKDTNDIWHVIGLVSWGWGCASPYPGIYTRVSNYNSWVCEKIGTC